MLRRIRVLVLVVVLLGCGAVLLRMERALNPRVPLETEATLAAEVAAQGDGPCLGVPLPADQHFVADGLCVGLVAAGHGRLRQLAFAPDGTLFGVNRAGEILRFHDDDGDGFYRRGGDEVTVWGDTGGNGNGVHIDVEGGWLYAGTPEGVARWAWSADLAAGGEPEHVIVGQPQGGHPTHTAHLWDGVLYVQSGSDGNATNPMSPAYDTRRSMIKRFVLASKPAGRPFHWDEGETFTLGLRNTNGFDRRSDGAIWGVVNGLDDVFYRGRDVHQDNPGEQVVEIAEGRRYGYPFCFTAQRVVTTAGLVRAGTQLFNETFRDNPHDDAWCAANSEQPGTFVQAHSAPLEILFFEAQPGDALPERWRGGAFISLHGSWNRDPSTGYKVIWMPFDAETGQPPMPVSTAEETRFPYEVVFGGGRAGAHADGRWTWTHERLGERTVRPVGLAISPVDGALYVSSDSEGDLYRIALRP